MALVMSHLVVGLDIFTVISDLSGFNREILKPE
jgi:hypothetical protein